MMTSPPGRPVVCLETGQRYKSVAAASRASGIDRSNISSAALTGNRAGGVHWYYDDVPKPDASWFKKRHTRPVVCIEQRCVYDSISLAASAVCVSQSNIWAAIRSGGLSGGYHWRYATPSEVSDHCAPVPFCT